MIVNIINQMNRKRKLSVEDVEIFSQEETDLWSITPQSTQVVSCAGIGLKIVARELSVGIATPTYNLHSKAPL